MKFETLKGTKDSLPNEQIKINKILEIISKGFEGYGFRPFDTPIIEYFDVLRYKYEEGDEILEEIFRLSDRGERSLGLRYDLTTPLARFVATEYKKLKKPFRRYQIGKVFRDGPIKTGRMREFVQCDGDVVGISGVEIEAELLIMFYEIYRKLEIDCVLEVNNNKILRGAFLQVGFDEKDLSSLILSVDKLKKIGVDSVLKEISENGYDEKKAKVAIDILGSKSFDEIRESAKEDLLIEGIDELERLVGLIAPFSEYRINFSMARGLDIYTGNIWEAYDKGDKVTSSIGSGGRYDKFVGDFMGYNDVVPAVGVSFGLVPILACLDDEKDKEGVSDMLIVPLEKDFILNAFDIAKKFRNSGDNVEIYYGYKLKRAFDYAEFLGCKKIAIIGKADMENGEYTLKDIVSGEERKIKF